jgi:hypothetical protein
MGSSRTSKTSFFEERLGHRETPHSSERAARIQRKELAFFSDKLLRKKPCYCEPVVKVCRKEEYGAMVNTVVGPYSSSIKFIPCSLLELTKTFDYVT